MNGITFFPRTSPLDTFIKDIVNVIEFEELSDVILVGHSLGGIVISGVADAARDCPRAGPFRMDCSSLPGKELPRTQIFNPH